MNEEKNGKPTDNETSVGSKLEDKINQYNLQYNLDNMILNDYEVYHTLLALISLAILSYQQVIGDYENKKKFEIDIRDQSPEAAQVIQMPEKKSQLLGLNKAFLQHVRPKIGMHQATSHERIAQ